MARKTWIKIKRGLLEPKHIRRIGPRVWVYMYILDGADWETGCIYHWKDQNVADDLGMEKRTVRDHRTKLEAEGYIECEQGYQELTIKIINWTNPREYSGDVYNVHGDIGMSPPKSIPDAEEPEEHGDKQDVTMNAENFAIQDDGDTHDDTHGDIHGDMHGAIGMSSSSFKSHITDHTSQNTIKKTGKDGALHGVRRALQSFHERTQKEGAIDLSDFPERQRPFIRTICDLWKIKPPKTKSSRKDWIRQTDDLIDACGEWGPAVIGQFFDEWMEHLEKRGKPPFWVAQPAALVNVCRAQAGIMRGATSRTPESEMKKFNENMTSRKVKALMEMEGISYQDALARIADDN